MAEKKQLKIFTASAGSGKTFQLTREFLLLILSPESDDYTFSSVQAVTFTNKATEEMKHRILEELYLLSGLAPETKVSAHQSFLLDEFSKVAKVGYSLPNLQAKARAVLLTILQDYNSFRVKTIDSFFQEVLRVLARELGLQGNFRPQIETADVFEQATLKVLTDLDNPTHKNKNSLMSIGLIRDLMKSLISDGKGSDPRATIRGLVAELKNEEVYIHQKEGRLMTADEVKSFKKCCQVLKKQLLGDIETWIKNFVSLISANFSVTDDLYGKSRHAFVPFFTLASLSQVELSAKLKDSKFSPIGTNLRAYLDNGDTSKVIKKDSTKHTLLSSLDIEGELAEFQKMHSLFVSILLALNLVDSYTFLAMVQEKVKEIQKEENIILLNDTSHLINEILSDSSGVHFLYEKLGTKIKYHMIDEFQDTSTLQYLNFLPLLDEAMANGQGQNLVVGDVKQSIYRFRNSNSALLHSVLPSYYEHSDSLEQIVLADNWRSLAKIVNFNNDFYTRFPKLLSQDFLNACYGFADSTIEEYYEAERVQQHIQRGGSEGRVVFYELEETKDKNKEEGEVSAVPKSFLKVLAELQQDGRRPSDIVILVRNRKEAVLVGEALVQASLEQDENSSVSYDFISSEALELQSAVSVSFIVALLDCIANPSSQLPRLSVSLLLKELIDPTNEAHKTYVDCFKLDDVASFEELYSHASRGLYELVELLFKKYDALFPKGEIPYRVKFLDLVLMFQKNKTADLLDFLEMYHNEGCTQNITSPYDPTKLILMTVHKSKGLGFPVVLLPFATWTTMPKTSGNNIWSSCEPLVDLGGLPVQFKEKVLPISFSSALLGSCFKQDYVNEVEKTSLDELNILYVATTRAKDELHIWYPRKTGEKQFENISGWLTIYTDLLNQNDQREDLIEFYKDEEYADGELEAISTQTKAEEQAIEEETNIEISDLSSYDVQDRIATLRQGLSIFDEDSKRQYGNVMHYILSNIITREDLTEAIEKALALGLLSSEWLEDIRLDLEQAFEQVKGYPHWFDGSATILNENAILGGENGVRRPDRVVCNADGSIEVIDYKFGSPKNFHKKQVLGYAELIKRMGYDDVKAYLWYVNAEKEAIRQLM